MEEVVGQIVDVVKGTIFPGRVRFDQGKIAAIEPLAKAPDRFILPGLIDAHIHIESTMLVPSEFARMAVLHGTVGTVSDPHEIANVLGIDGVTYMIDNGKTVPFHFYFGAPSCVPATCFETSGAVIDSEGVRKLLEREEILYLSEMMNYPGVIHQDEEVMKKIAHAKALGKHVDGHAPGVRGADLDAYLRGGITTDHEAFTYEEGLEKIQKGMKILIREGCAAKNFDALIPLLGEYPTQVMFCTDDQPSGWLEGHINLFLKRAVALGYDKMDVIRAATLNPVTHYGLKTGLLQVGDPATLIVVEDLKDFRVLETFIDGKKVASQGRALFQAPKPAAPNHFHCSPIEEKALAVNAPETVLAIVAIDGELVTHASREKLSDVLKLVVVNRYFDAPPAVAFIKNVGLKRGAIGASVAHDSHNIIAVGADDASITKAINALIASKGGLVAVDGDLIELLPLPVAGLMTTESGQVVDERLAHLNKKAFEMGCILSAPFITLSFMALLVIPELKLSDKGLFDAKRFEFISI